MCKKVRILQIWRQENSLQMRSNKSKPWNRSKPVVWSPERMISSKTHLPPVAKQMWIGPTPLRLTCEASPALRIKSNPDAVCNCITAKSILYEIGVSTYHKMITLQYIAGDYTCTYQNLVGKLSAAEWIASFQFLTAGPSSGIQAWQSDNVRKRQLCDNCGWLMHDNLTNDASFQGWAVLPPWNGSSAAWSWSKWKHSESANSPGFAAETK